MVRITTIRKNLVTNVQSETDCWVSRVPVFNEYLELTTGTHRVIEVHHFSYSMGTQQGVNVARVFLSY